MTIRHNVCGQSLSINLAGFEKMPYCRCCQPRNYSPEQFEKEVKELVGDDYEVLLPFVSQKEKVVLRHRRCGTKTKMYLVEFLNGHRCDVCMPLLSKNVVAGMVEEATDGKYQVEEQSESWAVIRNPDGSVSKKETKRIVQELTRPTPSELFPFRTKQLEPLISEKGKLYMEICDASRNSGKWSLSFRAEQGKERGGGGKNHIHWRVKKGAKSSLE